MNNKLLIVILCIVSSGIAIFMFPDGMSAILIAGLFTAIAFGAISLHLEDKAYLLHVFLIGLIVRLLFATASYKFSLNAFIVALCTSLIIWSSQGLKDGIIFFLLVLSVVCVVQLQKRFSYLSFLVLMISLFGVLSLRFYIFYMLVVAIVGCFAIGEPINAAS